MRTQDLRSDPLQEQQTVLCADPSLQPLVFLPFLLIMFCGSQNFKFYTFKISSNNLNNFGTIINCAVLAILELTL